MKGLLPDSVISKMNPKDRPRGWVSGEEAQRRFKRGEEKNLQRLVANWLNLQGIYYEQERMDKRTSGKVGRPDFRCCVKGKFVAIECKAEGCKLTDEQVHEFSRIHMSGGVTLIAWSLQDVISFIQTL
jgi:hypothetical protein